MSAGEALKVVALPAFGSLWMARTSCLKPDPPPDVLELLSQHKGDTAA